LQLNIISGLGGLRLGNLNPSCSVRLHLLAFHFAAQFITHTTISKRKRH